MAILITGSGGLIGSEAARFFINKGQEVIGIDNDMRSYFFGSTASIKWNINILKAESLYHHFSIDIRDFSALEEIFKDNFIDLVIHTAAQPSHDWATKEPITDFNVNANGTLNLLEATRLHHPEAVFIFTSTNKVYGDLPNQLPLIEMNTRYEINEQHPFYQGIDESMSIDQSKHSLFGVSKVAADLMVQEYGRYFNMKTITFRGGCLTGPLHSGAELHGFLAYLIQCILTEKPYRIFGYLGKQVRDNIHSTDLISAFHHVYQNPRGGEVYNIGGGRFSNISMLEAISKIENLCGKKANTTYLEHNRSGDHIWYISDIRKFQAHFPKWIQTYDIDLILEDMLLGFEKRL